MRTAAAVVTTRSVAAARKRSIAARMRMPPSLGSLVVERWTGGGWWVRVGRGWGGMCHDVGMKGKEG